MLHENLIQILGPSLVHTGRAIKVKNINLFSSLGFEITPEQFVVLDTLDKNVSMNQTELCEALYKDKSNMTRILSILSDKELIEKAPVVDKKLVNKVEITAKGKKLRDKIAPVLSNAHKEYFSNISASDICTCFKVLSQIQENLIEEN